jgi:hypothetical protein
MPSARPAANAGYRLWAGTRRTPYRSATRETGGVTLAYLSDVNLRAILTVLIVRAGGEVTITNEELYDAMMPHDGGRERFRVEETASGVRVSITDAA